VSGVGTLFPGLKLLSIRACPSVTPEGLLSILALPFLQHFDYFTRRPVPKSFVRGIAAQNPSLETISVHTTGDSENSKTKWTTKEKKAFFKKHPRIKALHNLVMMPFSINNSMWPCFNIALNINLLLLQAKLERCDEYNPDNYDYEYEDDSED